VDRRGRAEGADRAVAVGELPWAAIGPGSLCRQGVLFAAIEKVQIRLPQAQPAVSHSVSAGSYSAAKKESVAQRNARGMAATYLKYSSFSHSGLIAQLKFEGFTTAQAKYGVKKVGL
jgi:host cell surface-exposed lipoprotein